LEKSKPKGRRVKMTDKENVASEEAQNEPVPNPYNLKKSWHTADVMPTGGVETADSLFVAPVEKADDQQEGEPVAKKRTPYKKVEHNWKKRYDDLKTLRDNELGKWRNREQELIDEATASRPEYVAPKSIEELEQFKAQYPDVYDVVETVSHLQSEAKVEELTSKISALETREAEVLHREAESELLNKHPDYADIRDSDEFHEWAKIQPEDIQAWVYNNPNNVGLASRAIDLFKADIGIPQKRQTRNKSRRSNSKAADMVSTKTTTVESTGQPKIWTQEEIAALPMDEFDRLEAEIDLALEEGRVRL
jgi:Asp-tRNA(Asn)/Glu-tRNA(Gln) amidotransferase C subunit